MKLKNILVSVLILAVLALLVGMGGCYNLNDPEKFDIPEHSSLSQLSNEEIWNMIDALYLRFYPSIWGADSLDFACLAERSQIIEVYQNELRRRQGEEILRQNAELLELLEQINELLRCRSFLEPSNFWGDDPTTLLPQGGDFWGDSPTTLVPSAGFGWR